MVENRFNAFIEKLFDRSLLGFPLRVIFLEKWHKINAFLFFVGLLNLGAAKLFGVAMLKPLGAVLVIIPLICFGLLFILVILFLVLEKIYSR